MPHLISHFQGTSFLDDDLVSLKCYNNVPQTEQHNYNNELFFIVMEAGSLGLKCWWSHFW